MQEKGIRKKEKPIKVLELFAGIGTFSLALKKLGISYEIVDAVEIDKYAMQAFNAIHGTSFPTQDISQWDKDIEVDMICGGFPCQDVSIAGRQKGIIAGKTRSGLMYEMLRVVDKLHPRYVIAENVKNLLSPKFRPQLEEYLSFLGARGYSVAMDVMNCKDFGTPQNRARVFIIGVKDE